MADASSRMRPELEQALVARVREHADADAFEELYRFYLPRIYGFIFRRVRDHPAAEDLTSITFQRAVEALGQPDFRNQTVGGWLYRVASNAVIDHYRTGRQHVSMDESYGGNRPWDLASDVSSAAADRDELRRALASLPENHRSVLMLRFYDDLDNSEMCAVLGCSRPVLALRLHRAIRAMRLAVTGESSDVA